MCLPSLHAEFHFNHGYVEILSLCLYLFYDFFNNGSHVGVLQNDPI